jgi:REP element-mobilizing transposase RayT
MSEAYRIRDPYATHYLTLQVVDWVDIFTRQIYRDMVVDSLQYCRKNKGLLVYAYIVMSNHVHLIVRAENGNLSDVVRDIKKYTATAILKNIEEGIESRKEWILNRFAFAARKHVHNSTYQVWTHENHAVELFSPDFTQQKIDYIHLNPVRAGWVENPEDYLYSSARNYAGLPARIEIDFI